MKKTILIAAVLLVLAAALPGMRAWAADDYAAMILDVTPDAVFREEGENWPAVQAMDFLYPGDNIQVSENATLVLNYFASGTREELTGPGTLRVGLEGSEILTGLSLDKETLDYLPEKAELDKAHSQNFGSVAMRRGNTRDNRSQAKGLLLNKLNTAVRPGDQTFSWKPVSGASFYRVEIRDYKERVVASYDTDQTSLTVPAGLFAPKISYSWTVTAVEKGKAMDRSKGDFQLIKEQALEKVEKTEQTIFHRFQDTSSDVEELISLALLYEAHGLRDEAAQKLVLALERDPNNTAIKSRLKALNPNLAK